MKLFLSFISILGLSIAFRSIPQVQNHVEFKSHFSDTTRINIHDSLILKMESPYFNGHLLSSKNGKNWEKLWLGILLEDFDSVVELSPKTRNKIAYRFIPSGFLRLNDSCSFLIGTKSNFDQQGIILRTLNSGKSWKPMVHPIPNTPMSPHDLVFLNPEVAIAFFGVDQSEYIQYAQSLDAGDTWQFLRTNTNSIEIKKRKIRMEMQLEINGPLIRKIEGRLSTDKGNSYSSIQINHQ